MSTEPTTSQYLYELYKAATIEAAELHQRTGHWRADPDASPAYQAYMSALATASPEAERTLEHLIGRYDDMPEYFRRVVYPVDALRRLIASLFTRGGGR